MNWLNLLGDAMLAIIFVLGAAVPLWLVVGFLIRKWEAPNLRK